jgi:hypothetical protein
MAGFNFVFEYKIILVVCNFFTSSIQESSILFPVLFHRKASSTPILDNSYLSLSILLIAKVPAIAPSAVAKKMKPSLSMINFFDS